MLAKIGSLSILSWQCLISVRLQQFWKRRQTPVLVCEFAPSRWVEYGAGNRRNCRSESNHQSCVTSKPMGCHAFYYLVSDRGDVLYAVWPVEHAKLGALIGLNWRKRLLLHGPTGCGKSRLVYSVAEKTGSQLVTITSSTVIQNTVGTVPALRHFSLPEEASRCLQALAPRYESWYWLCVESWIKFCFCMSGLLSPLVRYLEDLADVYAIRRLSASFLPGMWWRQFVISIQASAY